MTLTPKHSRLLSVVLLILVILILWSAAVAPVARDIAIEHEALAQNVERLSRYQHLKDRESAITESVNGFSSLDFPVYRGESITAMSAEMRRDISSIAASQNIALGLVRPGTGESNVEQGFQRLSLQINLTATTSQLAQLLAAFRAHKQLLVVETANVRVANNSTENRAAQLSVRLEILAFGELGV